MKTILHAAYLSGALTGILGCATTQHQDDVWQGSSGQQAAVLSHRGSQPAKIESHAQQATESSLIQVQAEEPGSATPRSLALEDLSQIALSQHPRLAQVGWFVESVRGQALQAGLYPNPNLAIAGEELGDVQGPGGIWSAPQVSQEIVTANKLTLDRAALLRGVDQATLATVTERFRILAEVRRNYWLQVATQQRVETLTELLAIAESSVTQAQQLLKAREVSDLDVLQFEVERDRTEAELRAAENTLQANFRRLAASIGQPTLTQVPIEGRLDTYLPDYDLDAAIQYLVAVHPDLQAAALGVERARLVLERASVEPIPNVTVSTGYMWQGQNRSHDWLIGASLPVPVWNRNQGAIRSAQAELNIAQREVDRIQLELTGQLAEALSTYSAAKARAEKFSRLIIPKARKTLELAQKAYQGGQFEYLRVLEAQKSFVETRLQYLESLTEAWNAASTISGLLLEDEFPIKPAEPVAPPEPKQ